MRTKFISICISFIVRSLRRTFVHSFRNNFFFISSYASECTESCAVSGTIEYVCMGILEAYIQRHRIFARHCVPINACHNSQPTRKRDESAERNCEREAKNE